MRTTRQKETHQHAWTWVLCSSRVIALLKAVRPYLVIKGEQADVLQEFRPYSARYEKGISGRFKKPLSESEIVARDEIRTRLTLLKGRGAAA
jgi:hypothetical protein